MARTILKLLIILLILFNAGYMAFDGYHAFTTGDYIRPLEGEYAGQLGPWTMFASMAGIDPLSTHMKSIFLGCGIFGLLSLLIFIIRPRPGSALLLLFCFLTLWNIMFGAVSSFVTIILLLSWRKLHRARHVEEARKPSKEASSSGQ